MTTTTTEPITNVESSLFPPSLFNIQYPNCGRGMFSLRPPFKDMTTAVLPTEETRDLPPEIVQPIEEERPIEPVPRQKSKRNASIQCSLLTSNIHHDIAVQAKIDRQQTAVNQLYDDNDIPPQYYRHRKLRPVEQYEKVYEIWDVDSAPLQAIPINQTIRRREVPRARYVKKKPIIEYPDEEEVESDYNEERIMYARRPRKTIKKTYLPPNVRMICVRDDTNNVSY
jgi:hypothetical protein